MKGLYANGVLLLLATVITAAWGWTWVAVMLGLSTGFVFGMGSAIRLAAAALSGDEKHRGFAYEFIRQIALARAEREIARKMGEPR